MSTRALTKRALSRTRNVDDSNSTSLTSNKSTEINNNENESSSRSNGKKNVVKNFVSQGLLDDDDDDHDDNIQRRRTSVRNKAIATTETIENKVTLSKRRGSVKSNKISSFYSDNSDEDASDDDVNPPVQPIAKNKRSTLSNVNSRVAAVENRSRPTTRKTFSTTTTADENLGPTEGRPLSRLRKRATHVTELNADIITHSNTHKTSNDPQLNDYNPDTPIEQLLPNSSSHDESTSVDATNSSKTRSYQNKTPVLPPRPSMRSRSTDRSSQYKTPHILADNNNNNNNTTTNNNLYNNSPQINSFSQHRAPHILPSITQRKQMQSSINNTNTNNSSNAQKQNLLATPKLSSIIKNIIIISVFLCIYIFGLWQFSQNMPGLNADEKAQIVLPRTMAQLKGLAKILQSYNEQHPNYVLGLYIATYAFLQAFTIPMAVFLSILAGPIWGVPQGILIISFAATLGCTIAYIMHSTVGKNIILYLFPQRLAQLQEQIDENKDSLLFYVLFLRLMPVFPNWAVTMGAPALSVPWVPFAIGTFIGIIPNNYIMTTLGLSLDKLTDQDAKPSLSNFLPLFGIAIVALIPILLKKWCGIGPSTKKINEKQD